MYEKGQDTFSSQQVPPQPPAQSWKKWRYLLVGIIAIIAVVCYLLLTKNQDVNTNSEADTNQLPGERFIGNLDISENGKFIVFNYLRNGVINLYTADVDGSNVRKINLGNNFNPISPRYSADGSRIIFAAYYQGIDQPLSYLYHAKWDGTDLKQITADQEHILEAIFSKDESKIYYIKSEGFYSVGSISGERPRDYDIYEVDIDGTNPRALTDLNAYEISSLQLTPGGDSLFFRFTGDVQERFAFLDLQNLSKITYIISNGGTDPILSPDGNSVLFTKVADSNASSYTYDIYKMDISSKNITRLTTLNSYAVKPDYYNSGNSVMFLHGLNWPSREIEYEIMEMGVDGSNLKKLNLTIP